ncbi:MAG: c-type cytochrome, partial [Myxococcota bacterium]
MFMQRVEDQKIEVNLERIPGWLWIVGPVLGVLGVSFALWWALLKPVSKFEHVRLSEQQKEGKRIYERIGLWGESSPLTFAPSDVRRQRLGALPERWLVYYLLEPNVLLNQKRLRSYRQLLVQDAQGVYHLNEKGKALLSYLNHRVLEGVRFGQTAMERQQGQSTVWHTGKGKHLYRHYCAGCHGTRGRGDGVLSTLMGRRLPDLNQTRNILCRSAATPRFEDLVQTLKRGIPHAGMLPLGRFLRDAEILALVEYLRQRIFLPPESKKRSPYLEKLRAFPPTYRELQRKEFREALDRWWRVSHRAWKRRQPKRSSLRAYGLSEWREYMEWQRFHLWLQADPRRLQVSRADWAAEHRKRFPKVFVRWQKSGSLRSFMRFLKSDLKTRYMEAVAKGKVKERGVRSWWKKLTGRQSLANFLGWARGKGWQGDYVAWRSSKERLTQRQWLLSQDQEFFRAWQGKALFAEKCARCHGAGGEGRQIELSGVEGKKRVVRVRSWQTGALRCGSGKRDVFTSVLLGPHLAVLGEKDFASYRKSLKLPPVYRLPYTRRQ